jgi:hypothetical protein
MLSNDQKYQGAKRQRLAYGVLGIGKVQIRYVEIAAVCLAYLASVL